jgi:hypothetical protein
VLKEAAIALEQIDGVTEMHGAYYRVAAEYQKVKRGSVEQGWAIVVVVY